MDIDNTTGASPETGTSTPVETATPSVSTDTTSSAAPVPSTSNTRSASPDASAVPSGAVDPSATDKPDQASVQPQVHDWEKRYKDSVSWASRIQRERDEVNERYKGLPDPNQIRSILQEHEKRQKESTLKPWQAAAPTHSQFKERKSQLTGLNQAYSRLNTPEEQAAFKKAHAEELGSFTPDELRSFKEADQVAQRQLDDFHADPDNFIASRIEDKVEAIIERRIQFMNAQQEVQGFLSDPGNSQLIQKYAGDMQQIMDPSVPAHQKAVHYAQLKAENDALKARLSQQVEVDSHRDAQVDARTQVRRQSNVPVKQVHPPQDNLAILAERGFRPGTEEYSRELQKLNRR